MHFLQPNNSERIMSQTKHRHAPGTAFIPCVHIISGIDAIAIGIAHALNQHQSFTSDFCLVIKIKPVRFHESDRQTILRGTLFFAPYISDSISPLKAMVSTHLALEVHLIGRSIQAYLLALWEMLFYLVSCQVRFIFTKCTASPACLAS